MIKDINKRIEEITTDFVKEKQEMLSKFEEYRKIFVEELRVRQSIEKIYINRESKYQEEITELKSIVRVPRNYYKNLEKLNYEEIMQQKPK